MSVGPAPTKHKKTRATLRGTPGNTEREHDSFHFLCTIRIGRVQTSTANFLRIAASNRMIDKVGTGWCDRSGGDD